MADRHGFPLADSIAECLRRGWVPGLGDYVMSAKRAGWKKETALLRVEEGCRDALFAVPRLADRIDEVWK